MHKNVCRIVTVVHTSLDALYMYILVIQRKRGFRQTNCRLLSAYWTTVRYNEVRFLWK